MVADYRKNSKVLGTNVGLTYRHSELLAIIVLLVEARYSDRSGSICICESIAECARSGLSEGRFAHG